CRPMIHVIRSSSRIRVPIAKPSPSTRARCRSCSGSFPTRIVMNTMLSMPRTISSSVSVTSASQASGEAIHSITMRYRRPERSLRGRRATALLGGLVEQLRELRGREIAAEQLAVRVEHGRRAAYADAAPELEVLADDVRVANRIRHGAAELRAGQRGVAIL